MSTRAPIEHRDIVNFDARPHKAAVATAFRPRDLDDQWQEGAQGEVPHPPGPTAADRRVDMRQFERDLGAAADPEREHAVAFLRLTWGAVMDICRGIEGKPPSDDYDQPVSDLAAKMHRWATRKAADER